MLKGCLREFRIWQPHIFLPFPSQARGGLHTLFVMWPLPFRSHFKINGYTLLYNGYLVKNKTFEIVLH